MRITSITRTVDSNGRVWIRTETGHGDPGAYVPPAVQQVPFPMVPDSELAGLAALLRATSRG